MGGMNRSGNVVVESPLAFSRWPLISWHQLVVIAAAVVVYRAGY